MKTCMLSSFVFLGGKQTGNVNVVHAHVNERERNRIRFGEFVF